MPTDEELNPNTRFVDNRFVAQLAENDTLKKYVDEQGLSWSNDKEFIKNVLDTILSSEIYAEYLKNEEDSWVLAPDLQENNLWKRDDRGISGR